MLQSTMFGHEDFAQDPRDWVPAMILASELEKEIAERRIHLLRRLSAWYSLIKIFRSVEQEQMLKKDATSRDMEYHRALINFLVGSGELLVLELQNHRSIDPEHIGIPFACVTSQMEELREDSRMWHGGMTETRRKNIMRDVLGVA